MSRFVKLDAAGKQIAETSTDWSAVLDTKTSLIWSTAETERLTWKKAISHCKKLRLFGAKDWRLPTREELLSLVDDTRHNPTIDIAFFPKCQSAWYWSSTPYAPSPGVCAWLVYFSNGDAYWDGQSGDFQVRAVRSSQS